VAEVSSTNAFVAELRAAAAAGEAAIVTGNTDDVFVAPELPAPLRLPQLIATVHSQDGRCGVIYSMGKGGRPIGPPGEATATVPLPGRELSPGEALPGLLEAVTEHESPLAVIVDHAEMLIPRLPSSVTPTLDQAAIREALQATTTDPRFDGRGHALVLLARSAGLHSAIEEASGFRLVRAPLPNLDAVEFGLRLIEKRAEEQPRRFAALAPTTSVESTAAEARGLRIDELYRASRAAAATGTALEPEALRDRKAASIQRHAREALRLHPEGRTLEDVAGLPHIHAYVEEKLRAGGWPPSLLLAGPPGVGKTFVVRAIASALGRRVVSFHLVRSAWVGETEANTARALEAIDELAPIVVAFDEVDQSLGQRSTGPSSDGGTSERFQAALWEFTGEGAARPDVLFVLLTNRPDLLDQAQRNRVETIPILHPTPRDIVQLLPALASQLGHELDPEADLAELARDPKLRMTSARHLLRIIGRAAVLADGARDGRAIGQAHLARAIDDYRLDTNVLDEELMALTALSQTSFRSLLPWVAAEAQGLPREVPFYVEPLLGQGGELDHERLAARIRELSELVVTRRARRSW
jgi:ATPase family associated with various cellular activities (AAA)